MQYEEKEKPICDSNELELFIIQKNEPLSFGEIQVAYPSISKEELLNNLYKLSQTEKMLEINCFSFEERFFIVESLISHLKNQKSMFKR